MGAGLGGGGGLVAGVTLGWEALADAFFPDLAEGAGAGGWPVFALSVFAADPVSGTGCWASASCRSVGSVVAVMNEIRRSARFMAGLTVP